MMDLNAFVKEALESQNGVQNAEKDVWTEIGGEQYAVSVIDVLGREKQEPFEASYALEADPHHPAWDDLYEQYRASQVSPVESLVDSDCWDTRACF